MIDRKWTCGPLGARGGRRPRPTGGRSPGDARRPARHNAPIRRLLSHVALLALLALGVAPAAPPPAMAMAPYAPKTPPLSTPWTAAVSTTAPLPEYPRPQLQRSDWLNLNGLWEYEAGVAGQPPPTGQELPETILVPFPVQSALSGIMRDDRRGWYRRTFTVPRAWRGERVLLNFGAVSWWTRAWVNGILVGTHHGDYGSFSLDITRALRARGPNELIVGYLNPEGDAGEPVGKQAPGVPSGILHSPSSGIWQTVWLEPVSPAHIAALQLTPDLAHSRLLISATVTGGGPLDLAAQANQGRRVVASATGPAREALALPLPRPRLWWPWDPYLYGLRLQLFRPPPRRAAGAGRRPSPAPDVVDRVQSYFGMRSISLGRLGGMVRILLNGRFVFQTGALDQGYWPDGIYTAPTDAALRSDLLQARQLGYDMLREHAKVQPDRWYAWADRLGMLVWQDMPSMPLTTPHPPTASARREFLRELTDIVAQRRSHPSVVQWIPFNEGWQQFDLAGVTRRVRALDPAALVDSQSGSANCCAALETAASDVRDTHLYTGPFTVPPDGRASVVGEYGGILPFAPAADRWPGTQYSLGTPALSWPLPFITGVLRREYGMLGVEMRTQGLSGATFTELGATEQELGLVSYDRRVVTVPAWLLSGLNRRLIAASRALPTTAARRAKLPVVPPGTAGYWPLQEGQGTAAQDSSGAGHPLALTTTGRWTIGRQKQPALLLTGAGPAAATAAPVLDTTQSFTVSAWLRADARGESATAVSQLAAGGQVGFSLGLDTDTGDQGQSKAGERSSGVPLPPQRTWWTLAAPDAPGCACPVMANMHYDDGRLSVRPGRWHYVTGVFDRPSLTLSIYVDGAPQDVEHIDSVPPSNGPLVLGAGQGIYPAPDSFRGAISQLRVYARSLDPDEVWQLYQAQR